MKALISPTESVSHIVSWIPNPNTQSRTKYLPVMEVIPNAERVCEVMENEFEVAPPLFWVDCSNDVIADEYYYDNINAEIKVIVNAPYPEVKS